MSDSLQKFEKVIPAHLQEDILQRIEECAWGFMTDPDIEITDLEKRNVLNIEYTGVIRIDAVEHRFHIRSGNNAGTEILSWNMETDISREAPPDTMLVPLRAAIEEAIHQGRAADLLQAWSEALDPNTETGRRLARLPAASAYDAFFAPGTGASRVHHETARRAGFEIEDANIATERRRALLAAAHPLLPINLPDDPFEALRAWDDALGGHTVAGHRILLLHAQLIGEIAARGGAFPSPDEARRLEEAGFTFGTKSRALRLRTRLIRDLLSLEPIAGFDPATLPENPIAVLFNRLDPALAPETRVKPEFEGERLLDHVAVSLARSASLAVTESQQAAAAKIGFRILNAAETTPLNDHDLPAL